MASIELSAVQKIYPGNVTAIHPLDLSIGEGELVVLVGPSGCGKSTLLRMIAGLEAITKGTISIGGEVVNTREPAERDIAMVFQNYALYPHMTVRQNLEYGLKNRGTPRDEIDRRVTEAARVLEITPFLERKPRQLSGGQRQRVAMGRAIVRKPKAFLFDEPLSNLDAKLRGQMRVEIKRLQRDLKTTSVYVTHDQLEAMTLADRLVVMNGGRIEQVGSPMALYERPDTMFVASFIGSPPMNLIALADLPSASGLPLPQGTDIIGLRPNALHLEKPADAHIAVTARVELYEPVGGEAHLHMRMVHNDQFIVAALPVQIPVEAGTDITLYARSADLHPFNKASGRRTD